MQRTALLLILIGLLPACSASGPIPIVAKPMVIEQGDPGKAVDALVSRFESDMTKASTLMPAGDYDFTPSSLSIPGANFFKVRSFADQVKHVAQANYAIAGNISGSDPVGEIEAIAKLKGKDEILAGLARSFVAVHRAISTITIANENTPIDDAGVGPNQTKGSEAAWVAVHGYDHYGQMVEYLRLKGIVLKP